LTKMEDYSIFFCGYSRVDAVERLEYVTEYCEVVSVNSGYLHFIIDGKGYVVQKGETLFVREGCSCIRCATDEAVYYFKLCCSTEHGNVADLETSLMKTNTILQNLEKRIYKVFHNHNMKEREKVLALSVEYLALEIRELIETGYGNVYVMKILEYISEHLTGNISLEDVAKSVKLSVPYCCKLVKKEMKITIQNIIESERVLLAKDYLLANDIPVSKVAALCGFNEYNTFYKCFKRHMGMGPADFRKSARSVEE